MAINPNIILGIQPSSFKMADPLESAQKSLALQHLMGQQDLQGMQMRQAQQAEADDAATRDAFRAGGDRASIIQKLLGSGQWKAAQALEKTGLETEKLKGEVDKNKIEVLTKATAQHRDDLANVNDPQTAAAWVAAGYKNPVLAPVFASRGSLDDAIARIPTDPAAFQQWKQQNALGATKFIELNKPTYQDIGGSIVAVPGLGGAPQKFADKTNTPDAILTDNRTRSEGAANRGVTIRGQNMTDTRARETLEQGRWTNDLANGIQVNMATGATRPITTNGQPIQKDPKLTEDQGKATGWLVQADNAYKNMMAATKATKGEAARPGLPDVVAGISGPFGVGEKVAKGTANMMRGEERQKFLQASESLSEALLRAATGAGVNRDEAAQKVRELTPQVGDSDAVIQQKTEAIPLYIESLKVRAGPGALRLPEIRDRAVPKPKSVTVDY